MNKKIFHAILMVALTVFLASLMFIMGITYDYFTQLQRNQLRAETQLAAKGVSLSGRAYFADLQFNGYRVTWIAPDGTVLYDSQADNTQMENHLAREEVKEAFASGYGESSRYSSTLADQQLYAAQRLDDGTVLRLSIVQMSMWMLLLSFARPICIVVCIALVLSMLLASSLARRIVEPVNEIDLDEPERYYGQPEYAEVEPLLRRIASQQEQLKRDNAQIEKASLIRQEFTANVSHELKTPLHAISGYAELLENGMVRTEDIKPFAGKIRAESARMARLVEDIIDLTKLRTMGSVPFGGRYRLIDFPLSNMVNSDIDDVGVITKSNYGSLLDHLGSGREWDLSRKNGGLHLLPPFSHVGTGIYRGRLEALDGVWEYVEHSPAEYVVLSDCDIVTTIDYRPMIRAHIESGADITVAYSKGFYDKDVNQNATLLGIGEDGMVDDVMIDPPMRGTGNLCMDTFVLSKSFLKQLVKEKMSRNQYSLSRDVLQDKAAGYRIAAYEHTGYVARLDSLSSYYEANLALLNPENRNGLFKKSAPIYTKIMDNGPVRFGLESDIQNSLIADGCIIEGKVENCVLFRGVKIGKGTVVKNSVIMQNTSIGSKCSLNCVITDKDVEIVDDRVLTGSQSYPLYISKGAKI